MKENTSEHAVKVDIREAIRSKNPKLAKLLPGFIINYIRKVVHENDLNDILENYKDKKGTEFLEAMSQDFNITTEIFGKENVPATGRFIFASNHPLGGADGIFLMHVMYNHFFKNFRFLVNDLLMFLKPMEELFLPVNKHGRQSPEAAEITINLFESDTQILTFPAGLVSRKIKGSIVDLEWKKNFIAKAVQYKRDIIPVYISGKNSKFFYNLANFRKSVGIKANIEMFFLVDELFKQKNATIKMYFGKPIPYTTFDRSKSPRDWAAWVKEKVYEMRD